MHSLVIVLILCGMVAMNYEYAEDTPQRYYPCIICLNHSVSSILQHHEFSCDCPVPVWWGGYDYAKNTPQRHLTFQPTGFGKSSEVSRQDNITELDTVFKGLYHT